MVNANTAWAPLAEERLKLIDRLDELAEEMLPLLARLNAVSQKQIGVLDGCHGLDALRGTSIETQTRGANSLLRVYLVRKLGLLQDFADHASFLPPAPNKMHGQDVTVSARLFAVPKKELI